MKLSAGRSTSRTWLGAWAVTAVAVASLGAVPGPSDGAPADRAPTRSTSASGDPDGRTNYDARHLGGDRLVRAQTRQVRTNGKAVRTLQRQLGTGAVIDVDPVTGTPAQVAGRAPLTSASNRSAGAVALGFVRDHLTAFGLESADLRTLVRVRQYTDLHGITHVYWAQQVAGDRVFGNGLRAHVDQAGRLISVQGAPVARLGTLARRAPSARISRSAAIRTAVADARIARPDLRASGAERVWFLAPGGLRPAWLTYTEPGPAAAYEHVIDATTGVTLYRRSTIDFEGSGDAYVHEHYPGATGDSSGGRQHHVNLIKLGFQLRKANFPKGKYATVWADLNDDNKRQDNETSAVPRNRAEARAVRLQPFATAPGELKCTKAYICTWDPSTARSWRTNMTQDALEGLYLISKFAKWLSKEPFGFDRSSGNFTRADHDPVDLNGLDGANTDHGFPDGDHVNNANFNTPPDGRRPRMQMYLNDNPYLAASSSDDFLTLSHEFTHGLSNRLVVNANNHSTLNSYQGGAMGEGWSDFYAFDYVVTRGFATNTDAPGELTLDLYLAKNKAGITRTEAIDCGLGESDPNCQQVATGDPGGYTFDDVGDGQLGTEVHSAGEVWAQTLFDIWQQLGHRVTMAVTTEGMRLSADDPSMLDMRDAIIAADEAIYGGAHEDALWAAFAARGFGFYAGSDDGADAAPVADFNTPPPPGTPKGRIAGTVTDGDGNPLAGAVVRIAGHSEFADVADADGKYRIARVPAGTWPKVVAADAGYEPHSEAVTVVGGERTTYDPSLRRDWASASGGASVASFTGPDYTPFGCGPENAIDLSQGAGWGSDTTADGNPGDSEDDIDPKEIVIELPETITATAFGINPTATCGDPGSASTKDFEIYVAPTPAGPWGSPVAEGTFTPEDRGQLVELSLAAPADNVGAIRYVMLSPQVPDWNGCPTDYAGCQYMDTTEIAAYDD
jgi:extracellular elastinolytic metalloproteinase